MTVREANVEAYRLPFVTLALGVDEAAEVTNSVDLPARMSHGGLELAALIPPQHQPASSAVFPKHEREARPVDRIDHETDKGATLLVRQVNAKEVLEVAGATGIELVFSVAHRQRRLLYRGRRTAGELRGRTAQIQAHQKDKRRKVEVASRHGY
jgi:hypothetical protein